jgi:hypothetical protein
MAQLVQVAASLLILAAFAAAQRGTLTPASTVYLSLNLAGSAVLAVQAAQQHQLGFLLLEATWALVSAYGLAARLRTAGGPSKP